jgi:hypothetical protein
LEKSGQEMKQASHRRTNAARFHLYEVLRVVKFIEIESRMAVAILQPREGEKGSGAQELQFDGYRVLV